MTIRCGLFLVRSKIMDPALTPEVFRQWYEQVHIPHLLGTGKIPASARYTLSSSSPPPEDGQEPTRPYLAVYPVTDLDWLKTPDCSFFTIPLHDDMLPNASKFVFDVAAFDARFFERVVGVESRFVKGPAKHLIIVLISLEAAGEQEPESLLHASLPAGEADRSTLFKFEFAPGAKEGSAEKLAGYVAVHEFTELPDGVTGAKQAGYESATYNFLSSFGDTEVKI
ncbi:hypothetical protein B0T24DRAFT_72567 [Lasiosphaeria ovina]|uniref:EthD domain-containing protein n=1 Tax=Lasiosphaeria ovina TaxID=92902 RepID=A0AAE0TYG8_9PEZI|nr:hypothetical protein B0T24DRAFT_72567 [Lasiosphaeria ovina]